MGKKAKVPRRKWWYFPKRKTSSAQYNIMLKFFEQNNDLLQEKVESWREDLKKKWKELTDLLNAERTGPQKSDQKWRKTLKDWKSYVKAKARRIAIRENKMYDVSPPPSKEALSSTDRKLLMLIGKRVENEDLAINDKGLTIDFVEPNGKTFTYTFPENEESAPESEVVNKENVSDASTSFNLKRGMGTNMLDSRLKMFEVEENNLEALSKEVSALERIASAREREATVAEQLYFLKKRKFEESTAEE